MTGLGVCVRAMFPSYHKRAPPQRKHEKQCVTDKLLSFRLLLNPLCMLKSFLCFGSSIVKDFLRTITWWFMISRLMSWEIPTLQNRFWTSQTSNKCQWTKTLAKHRAHEKCGCCSISEENKITNADLALYHNLNGCDWSYITHSSTNCIKQYELSCRDYYKWSKRKR